MKPKCTVCDDTGIMQRSDQELGECFFCDAYRVRTKREPRHDFIDDTTGICGVCGDDIGAEQHDGTGESAK